MVFSFGILRRVHGDWLLAIESRLLDCCGSPFDADRGLGGTLLPLLRGFEAGSSARVTEEKLVDD